MQQLSHIHTYIYIYIYRERERGRERERFLFHVWTVQSSIPALFQEKLIGEEAQDFASSLSTEDLNQPCHVVGD
jgi:hypothetical protein